MRQWTLDLPFLPELMNAGESCQGRKPRGGVKAWKKSIAQQWAELGRPQVQSIRISIVLSFPDYEACNINNCLTMMRKLAGDGIEGIFIPDKVACHFVGWDFRFEFGREAKVAFMIEEVDKKAKAPSSPGFAACRLSEECVAPLCPLDESSLRGVWYPGEDICPSRTHGNLPWIKVQRKIARASGSGYFTLDLLNSVRTIREGITGLDPNIEEGPQLRRWYKLHEKKRRPNGGKENRVGLYDEGNRIPDGPDRRPQKPTFSPSSKRVETGGASKKFVPRRRVQASKPEREG